MLFQTPINGIAKVDRIVANIETLASDLDEAVNECKEEITDKNIKIANLQAEVERNTTAKDQAIRLKNNILGLLK